MYYRVVRPSALTLGALGALERRNPLPAGHYRIDVFGDDRDKMANWVKSHKSAVQVESTTDDKGQTWYFTQAILDYNTWLGMQTDEDSATASVRYVFRTTADLPWDAQTFGFPDIIVDPPPGTKPAPVPASAPASPGTKPKPGAAPPPSTGISTTVIAVAAGVVLIGAVAFALLHRPKAA